jgi:hypothetical protein
MKILWIFVILQLADFGTTIAALSLGGAEMNPIVGRLMGLGVYGGLALAKLIVLAVGGLAAYFGRYSGLRKVNIAFTVVVLWNLGIIGRLMAA